MKTTTLSFCALFLCFFLFSSAVNAQTTRARKLYKEAEKAFSEDNFSQSEEWCEKALHQSPGYADAQFLLGKCQYKLQQPGEALKQFSELSQLSGVPPEVQYWMGLAYKMQGDYSRSIGCFEAYLSETIGRSPQSLRAKVEREGALLALAAKAPENENFEFNNVGERINTPKDEYAVAFGGSSLRLVVSISDMTNSRHGENTKYLYAQGWTQANESDEFDFLNTNQHEGTGVMDKNGEAYYFTRCHDSKCKIYASYKSDGVWLKAVVLNENINAPESSSKAPALSVAGDTLFFASNRRGSIGGFDIWFSVKEVQGTWSNAVNLGEPINTPFDETTPFYGSDGSFYFASDGHPGYGGLDIFYVIGLNATRQVVNAGIPFNSSYNDLSLIANEENGYLASDRPGGFGGYDIYTFTNSRKEEPESESLMSSLEHQALYATLFTSKLYELSPKFLPGDHAVYSGLGKLQKRQLDKTVADQVAAMPSDEKVRIKKEDKILLAALSKEERFFIDRMAAAYFETSGADVLNLSEEDILWLQQRPVSDQRKYYRLMASNVSDVQQEFIAMNTPLIEDEDTHNAEIEGIPQPPRRVFSQKSSLSLVRDYEGEVYASAALQSLEETNETEEETEMSAEPEKQEPINQASETKPLRAHEPAVEEPAMAIRTKASSGETPAEVRSSGKALQFFQSLSFPDRKRVERIMAIKLVNEKYVLNPGLSARDRSFYQRLPAQEKAVIDRLQRYFSSWNFDAESANLRESDFGYLAALEEEKRQTVLRLVVQRSIGIDEDALVKFSGPDWERYKRFSEVEIENIKDVAVMLKSRQKVFDVALAYADSDYAFNDNLALRNSSGTRPVQIASTDPEIPLGKIGHTYESVYFDPGNVNLRSEAVAALNELVELYRQNPGIGIGLSAFSGDGANAAENRQLSTMRAKAAREYMVSKGIPDYRVKTEAHVLPNIPLGPEQIESLKSRKLEVSIFNASHVFESATTAYLVQPGNTLYSLSKANGMSVEELMAMNGLNDYTIMAYQPLRVRKEATLDPEFMVEPSTELFYVDSPEPSSDAADVHDAQEPEEEATQQLDRGDEILTIQVNETPVEAKVYHVVKKGEKLKSICEKYGVKETDILQMNRKKNRRVKVGERLLIRR